jgi:hypothetical protein
MLIATTASAQEPRREQFSFGVVATPALEGGGPWFLPAVRISAPLHRRIGFDADAGPLFGGSNEFVTIKSHFAGRFRFNKGPRSEEGNGGYWVVGLQYFPATKADQAGNPYRHHYTALVVGRGWDWVAPKGLLAINEIGFSGGDGFMVYGSFGLGWTPRRATPTAAAAVLPDRTPQRSRRSSR